MIPRVIHYCWFGRGELPDLAKKCIASWKTFLPDYEIKEWNEDNFDVTIIPYTREAYRLKKYAFVSDYARMWILYHYGGLYFDTDVEIIKPMDDIIQRGSFMGMEAGSEEMAGQTVNPGLGLGVVPGLGLIKETLNVYEHKHFISIDGRITETIVNIVSRIVGSMPMKCLDGNVMDCGEVVVYPPEYFCPMNYYTGELKITANTRSIHHYKASWMSTPLTIIEKIRKRIKYIFVRFT